MATKTKTTAPDRTADALKLLEEGIQRLTSTKEWLRYLKMQAAFHAYSFSNVQLIMAQRPDATKVAGFRTWEKLGRHVRKGEKGIWILAPRFFKPKADEAAPTTKGDDDQDDEAHARIYFKACAVFALEQTDGEDLPSPVKKLEGDDDGGLFVRLMAYAEAQGCPVAVEEFEGRANGYYEPERHAITVRGSLSGTQKAKTLAHELAHSLLHRDIEVYREHRADSELEAESVAFVVLAHAGLDSGDYTFGYVTTWQGGGDEAIAALKASANRIQKTARSIIEGLGSEGDPLE